MVLFGDGSPMISTYLIDNAQTLYRQVNLNDFGFNIAFKAERINMDESRTTIHDEDMVSYAIIIDETDQNGYVKI